MNGEIVEGDQNQKEQTVEGDQRQTRQTIEGNQYLDEQRVKGHQYQSGQTVKGYQYLDRQTVDGDIVIADIHNGGPEAQRIMDELSEEVGLHENLLTLEMLLKKFGRATKPSLDEQLDLGLEAAGMLMDLDISELNT